MNGQHNDLDNRCDCYQCEITRCIAGYMLFWMEPTDRALWQYPAPRLPMPG